MFQILFGYLKLTTTESDFAYQVVTDGGGNSNRDISAKFESSRK